MSTEGIVVTEEASVSKAIVILSPEQADHIKDALHVLASLLSAEAERQQAEIENELEAVLADLAKLTDSLDGHTIDEDDDTEASI